MSSNELIPLSYLAQYYYCKRRAALLLLDNVWADNLYTAEGSAEHELVHTQRIERRDNKLKIYEMPVYSKEIGLSGKCDCIEADLSKNEVYIPWLGDKYKLFPIEYKHGQIRNEKEYNIQLCAQAMCLEEMFNITIAKGAVFYINSHRRVEVLFSEELRKTVKLGTENLNIMLKRGELPTALYSAKCKKCSLNEVCIPKTLDVNKYMKILIQEAKGDL